jgi:hypothetical protein
MFKDRVRERDLDHFLIEELQCSTSFRGWFLTQLVHCFEVPGICAPQAERAARRTGDGRETDVRLSFADNTGSTIAEILIENKVTEDFQDGQAESYTTEVNARRKELGSNRVAAVLVAPEAKLRILKGTSSFDCAISVEAMTAAITDRAAQIDNEELQRRLMVKKELLDAIAGKQANSRWIPATVQEKRDFARQYEELAREIVPHLSVRPSTDGPKALTRFFEGLRLPSAFPCRVSLKHEFGAGVSLKYVNLQFDGKADAIEVLAGAPDIFPQDRTIFAARGGKSLMVRIATPGLTPEGERFDEQHEKIVEGLKAVGRLSEWLGQHGPRLRDLLR